ncbi:CpsB/CapC family capsule biosynthesis tyrosine phosphatase [Methylomicrobium sp. Wu6]|uniref:tyrosine-protein phosphatase n=1 Tax=Methylomicrobium sp. Wu6 TaxID=3107928 RepID=UPI002DD6AF07|nr:CpsB/CapC family capsule biosynthesis tyrosine phosphatase [Methylomicrobium sp. Wu6]MEC4747779.1 CpsB/CapC family capsule biosynthesis tyrosine phosphatase [Methylomicrobium sp. Wu6]
MIDLHCHMLPGIDDGPKTMEQALEMARFAVDHGTRRCVLTPHIKPGCYDNDIENIRRVFEAFQNRLAGENIPLQVGMAAEVRVCAELPGLINQGRIPFLGRWQGMRLILLEFPHDQIPVGADKLIDWLIGRDILPLIAHPERNQGVMRHPEKIKPFVSRGCLLQITADSVTGLFGEVSQQLALSFIRKDMAMLIATDAHNLYKRRPTLKAAHDMLLPIIGGDKTRALFSGNAETMLS